LAPLGVPEKLTVSSVSSLAGTSARLGACSGFFLRPKSEKLTFSPLCVADTVSVDLDAASVNFSLPSKPFSPPCVGEKGFSLSGVRRLDEYEGLRGYSRGFRPPAAGKSPADCCLTGVPKHPCREVRPDLYFRSTLSGCCLLFNAGHRPGRASARGMGMIIPPFLEEITVFRFDSRL